MMHEFDVVALSVPLPDAHMYDGSDSLRIGDRGTIVDASPDGRYLTVEFFRNEETVAIETVTPGQVRLVWQYVPTARPKAIRA